MYMIWDMHYYFTYKISYSIYQAMLYVISYMLYKMHLIRNICKKYSEGLRIAILCKQFRHANMSM